jgi:hypothetical protein
MTEHKSKHKGDWTESELQFKWGPHMSMGMISDELVKLLIDKGKEVRKPEFDWSHELAGKLKEEYTYNDIEGDHWNEWFVPLFHEHILNYINTLGPGRSRHITTNAKNFTWDLTRLWVNYQGPGEYNPPHNHAGDLSFVIYPDIPQEMIDEADAMKDTADSNKTAPGSIVFEYGERKFGDFLSFCNTSCSLIPSTGLCIIFPAYLTHHAYAFHSDVERVSVSGNISFHWEENEEGVPL